MRDRRYRLDSEFHLAPECPRRDTPRGNRSPPSQERGKARKPPFAAISMGTPVSARKAEHVESEETKSACEQSSSITLVAWGLFLVADEGGEVVLDTGATTN